MPALGLTTSLRGDFVVSHDARWSLWSGGGWVLRWCTAILPPASEQNLCAGAQASPPRTDSTGPTPPNAPGQPLQCTPAFGSSAAHACGERLRSCKQQQGHVSGGPGGREGAGARGGVGAAAGAWPVDGGAEMGPRGRHWERRGLRSTTAVGCRPHRRRVAGNCRR